MLGELEVRHSVLTVVLHGELDITIVDGLRRLLETAVDGQPRRLMIDLHDVDFVDVVSLSAILAAVDAVRDQGGQAFVGGAPRQVRRMCALLGADDAIAIRLPEQRLATG